MSFRQHFLAIVILVDNSFYKKNNAIAGHINSTFCNEILNSEIFPSKLTRRAPWPENKLNRTTQSAAITATKAVDQRHQERCSISLSRQWNIFVFRKWELLWNLLSYMHLFSSNYPWEQMYNNMVKISDSWGVELLIIYC